MVKSKKKYDWQIGNPPPDLDDHSQTKHMLIADYLKRYVEVYMSNTAIERLSLTIVDGFAGGGRYLDAQDATLIDGSPFLILKSIKEAEIAINVGRLKTPRYIDVEYHFIEKEAPHLEFLEQELRYSEYAPILGTQISLYRASFSEVAPKLIERICKRNRSKRAIFILDQYAYKDVPFPLINNILTNTDSEVILTFNYDSLQGYLADTGPNKRAMENIGLVQYIHWERLALFKEAGMWKHAIQEQLANAILVASSAKHMTLFFITPKKGWSYWLVHLSKRYRARDVMMDLHWKYSNCSASFEHYLGDGIFSLGYQATEIAGQKSLDLVVPFDFGAESRKRCVEKLSEAIPKILFDEYAAVSFSEITDRIGSFTPASQKELMSALQPSLDNREIIITSSEGAKRQKSTQIKPTDIIRYNQRQLFL